MYTTGDFLITIKNAYKANKKQVVYPHSKVVAAIADILAKEGYLISAKVKSEKSKAGNEIKKLELELKYNGRIPAIAEIKLLSKPSIHRYVDHSHIAKNMIRQGITILSTSSGVMSGKEAIKKGVGGELICQIS